MVFSSLTFLFYFLPLFLIVYLSVPKRLKNLWILISSIVFYAWGAPLFVFVILGSTALDFFIVKTLHKSNDDKRRKQLLFLSLAINLGLLLYFKYANFFIENVNNALSSLGGSTIGWTEVALPIGISFYTFQTLTYSIDVYRRKQVPLERMSDYMMYIMSFPQMIAGPIVRFNEVADQIRTRNETDEDRLIGLYRFGIGLAKKVLIANAMAQQAEELLAGDISLLSGQAAWIGMCAYTLQIYFDFAGYSDMAIGLGRMMGFRFPENFRSPYIATSITNFWRQWHITLGTFMRDYLYIPLGGNRVSSNGRLYVNLITVFLLSGLWHGASWNFVIWGAFHGVFLIFDRLFLKKILDYLPKLLSILITLLIVMVGWVFFRIEDFDQAILLLTKMFSLESGAEFNIKKSFVVMALIGAMFSLIVATRLGKKLEHFFFEKDKYTLTQHLCLGIMTAGLVIMSTSSIMASGFNPFIYFRF